MCNLFVLGMDKYQGDLTDIVRGTGGPLGCGAASASDVSSPTWKFPSDPISFQPSTTTSFGDPFSTMRDPLLTELNAAGSNYFSSPTSSDMMMSTSMEDTVTGFYGASSNMQTTSSIFPRIQISPAPPKLPVSPCDSPVIAAAPSPAVVPSDMSSKGCLMDSTGPVQISSPRNLGIKKRLGKCQAKKVVCIPAPAAVNSRSSGEVVPSDLWAWRKYGQKPIKGSPYPRGYYRCSSSKGCSARKQVERSRTDPNMLVITYTSEHNHPWPTQRNALAGSTRSQPSKTTSKSSPSSSEQPQTKGKATKDEMKESSNDTFSDPVVPGSSTASVKEEMEDIEKQLEMEDADIFNADEVFHQSYKPTLPDSTHHHPEDFFADLDELDAELLFPKGEDQKENSSKGGMDFSFFDWDNNSFGEHHKGGL
ncbi:hypothetical protein SLA2020_100760 [Shorea laevis]